MKFIWLCLMTELKYIHLRRMVSGISLERKDLLKIQSKRRNLLLVDIPENGLAPGDPVKMFWLIHKKTLPFLVNLLWSLKIL